MFPNRPESRPSHWCALVIGNSRLHWALFLGQNLQQSWDVPSADARHTDGSGAETDFNIPQQWSEWTCLSPAFEQVSDVGEAWPPLWVISVVPTPTQFWLHYPQVTLLRLPDVPLPGVYDTLGCDRALATWAAGQIYSWPILVIDGGTALTLTGADANGHLVGGAILPGLRLQLQSLAGSTALPAIELSNPPSRWATNTTDAILSGVLYTLWSGLADFIRSWRQDFTYGTIVLTGGDHQLIFQGLQTLSGQERLETTAGTQDRQNQLVCDEMLLFRGIQRLRTKRLESQ